MSCYDGNEYLAMLNRAVVIEVSGDDVLIQRKEEADHDGQCALQLGRRRSLTWAISVDAVVVSTCPGFITRPEFRRDFDVDIQHVQGRGWKRVVVFAACCGTYPEWLEQEVREHFPKIEWQFPLVRDFYSRPYEYRYEIVDDLLEAGVLQLVG